MLHCRRWRGDANPGEEDRAFIPPVGFLADLQPVQRAHCCPGVRHIIHTTDARSRLVREATVWKLTVLQPGNGFFMLILPSRNAETPLPS